VKTGLIRIGNSRGVRIPKPFIAECGLGESVDLQVENGRLIVSSERRPREGWAEAFNAAGSAENDELLLEPAAPSDFDQKEWRW
jgi:antitoxin MazE